ncbi:MAG TPA: hypothetical protein VN317_06610 [Candidatus Methanoperedens sp.]|nr:hypothetical protein [Candidatus Methanoperedens sp.]
MSRSIRKTPKRGITAARSEKADKIAAHRRERRAVHSCLQATSVPEVLPEGRALSNVWDYAKDGKQYLRKPRAEDVRK